MESTSSARATKGDENAHFDAINERPVDDISLRFFYKPHTITLLVVTVLGVLYFGLTRDDADRDTNIWNGVCLVFIFFLAFSMLTFPNGPFTRPHPAVWRIVFGLSVLYSMFLLALVFQKYEDIKEIIYWLYPDLRDWKPDDKEYAVNCSDVSIERLWSHMDVFAFGHFWGWTLRSVLIRHYGICWTISVTWELTELAFIHLLPNFAECWWDALILDVLLCNGLGIWFGMFIARRLEMRNYHWESIKDIHSTTGKIRRAVLQFTPVSWTKVKWMDPYSTPMRFIAFMTLLMMVQIIDLNTFFLKHVFLYSTGHPLGIIRLIMVGLFAAPSIRQYYSYVTDTQCTRLPSQCWMFLFMSSTEAIICLKFGVQLFKQTIITYMIIWLILMCLSSIICVYISALVARRAQKSQQGKEEATKTITASRLSRGGIHKMVTSTRTSTVTTKVSNSDSANGYNLRQRRMMSP